MTRGSPVIIETFLRFQFLERLLPRVVQDSNPLQSDLQSDALPYELTTLTWPSLHPMFGTDCAKALAC